MITHNAVPIADTFAEAGYGPDDNPDAPPRVYEVEALDEVEADPDEDAEFESYRGKRFRVIREAPFEDEDRDGT